MLARRGLLHVENVFSPTTQASGFAAGRNRAGYLDRLLTFVDMYQGFNLLLGLAYVPSARNVFAGGFSNLRHMAVQPAGH